MSRAFVHQTSHRLVFYLLVLSTLLIQTSAMAKLGHTFPNFQAFTTIGLIDLYSWLGDSWGILFSHPADFTPVCTTELARVVNLQDEFKKRNVKCIALSCDSVLMHESWAIDIKNWARYKDDFPYPIIADERRQLATQLDIIDPDEKDAAGIPTTCRAVFVIDPKKKMRLSILYPATTGRNFDEILRAIDSLQLTDKYKVATPVDWKMGEDVMVQPSVSDEEAAKLFTKVVKLKVNSGKEYMRRTPCPSDS